MSSVPFYRAFEDRYRGDRGVIRQRLLAYAPFLAPLATLAPRPAALDLGCGRGEWLELLGEQGLQARGVDLDAGMLAACVERGLQVEQTDAVAALRACADNSLALVSAFHLVEHIPFAVLQTLIDEALRALQPGGLLIMETPNPENLSVGATSFYLDPSHEKPLPPALLGFLADYAGFGRQRTVRLQEPAALHDAAQPVTLIDVLENVSPDYAIVAQKPASAAVLAPFDAAWTRDYGYSLGMLAQRFEATGAARLADLHRAVAQQAEGLVTLNQRHATAMADASALARQLLAQQADAEARATWQDQQVQQQVRELSARIDQANQATQAALVHAQAMHQQVLDMLNSRSWKLTAPYRRLGALLLRLRNGGRRRARAAVLGAARATLRQPLLSRIARGLLARLPGVQARVRGLLHQPAPGAAVLPPAPLAADGDLSPRADRIYQELKHTLEARTH
jgi:O-antigen chain-terminating methyltransferase